MKEKEVAVIMLSVIGLTVFELLRSALLHS